MAAVLARTLMAGLDPGDAEAQRLVHQVLDRVPGGALALVGPALEAAPGAPAAREPMVAVLSAWVERGELNPAIAVGELWLTHAALRPESPTAQQVAALVSLAHQRLDEDLLEQAVLRRQALVELLDQRLGSSDPHTHRARVWLSALRSVRLRYRRSGPPG